MRLANNSGFTLVEILLVVVIIGILAGLVVPNYMGRSEQAKVSAAKADINGGLSSALDLYELDNGRYPDSLDALVNDPGNARNWNGPYLKKGLPVDPWENAYQYVYPGTNNKRFYDLSSRGADGAAGTADDIENWGKQSQ